MELGNIWLAGPVATTSFTTEAELPSLTICQQRKEFRIGALPPFKLTQDDYVNGKFFPELNTSDDEAEEIFHKSLNDNYYLLDVTGSCTFYTFYSLKGRALIIFCNQRRQIRARLYFLSKEGSTDFTLGL